MKAQYQSIELKIVLLGEDLITTSLGTDQKETGINAGSFWWGA